MKVVNRDGDLVSVSYEAIRSRLLGLCSEEEQVFLDVDVIIVQTIAGLHDSITTAELDDLSAMVSASMQSKHYLYDVLAGRILVSSLHKNVRRLVGTDKPATFSEKVRYLGEEVFNADFLSFVEKHQAKLDAAMDYSRDMDYLTYFAFRTLEKAYLMRKDGKVIETPQDLWMRVAVALYCKRDGEIGDDSRRLEAIKLVYDQMSRGLYTHATPTLFNAGTRFEQMSSCYLLGTDDSLSGIFKTIGDCAQISKWAGGIGVHISNIRARGSVISSTNGKSDGIIPMLKVYNETARYCNQCFVPDTIIYTKDGCKAIKDVVPGEDLVLTSDGTYRRVMDRVINQKLEDILVIRPKYAITPLECTSVHEIYALTGQTTSTNYHVIRNRLDKGIALPGFVPASTLDVHDFMVYPIPKAIEQDESGVSEEDCRFYGIMIGNCRVTGQVCALTIGESASMIQQYLLEKNIDYWISSEEIEFYHSERLPFAKDDLKRVSPTFSQVSNAKVLQIIKGILEEVGGDFSYGDHIRASFTSQALAEDVKYLLLRLGVPSSGTRRSSDGGYQLEIPKDAELCKNLGIPASTRDLEYFVWNGLIFNRIRSIDTRTYEGDVFDLCIEGNHNYTTSCGLVHNSGRRKGSIAAYLEPWHADVFEFIELRRQTGAETVRARDMFLALWVPDLFMQRVVEDGDWYLMSPDVCPGLQDSWGEHFETLYQTYVDQGRYIRKVSARTLWMGVLQSQIETGMPYIMYKDTVNRCCNQNNVGTIRSSNLCVAPETQILTSTGYRQISQLQDSEVDVWNGEQFSRVVVRKTGEDQPLLTVHFSNGESLDCTHYHKFFIQEGQSARDGKEVIVEAQDLKPGMKIVKFSLPLLDDDQFSDDFKTPYIHGLLCSQDGDAPRVPEPLFSRIENASAMFRTDENGSSWYEVRLPEDAAPKYAVPVGQKLSIKLRWLEGVADGAGHIDQDERLVLTLSLSEFRSTLKRLLDTMGIASSVDERAVVVSSPGFARLVKLGFSPNLLTSWHRPRGFEETDDSLVQVEMIQDSGRRADTFCFTEPLANAGVFNGIRISNCSEITQYSDKDTYAVCNLASIAVNRFWDEKTRQYDFDGLHFAAEQVTRNLNRIIDLNYYPTQETKRSNVMMRPIGIGVQGLGDLYNVIGLDYDSAPAVKLDAEIMETIYHGAITASVELAIQEGAYTMCQGSLFSEGKLQFDLYPDFDHNSLKYDWAPLRCLMREYGVRNSMLTALMPTASTSQILGNSEGMEPIQSNVFKRSTLAGEFLVVNRNLMRDLIAAGLWTEELRMRLIAQDGCISSMTDIPESLRRKYRTVWELPQRSVIDHAAARSKFVDQSQSMNLYFAVPNYQKLNSALVYGWKSGLKTGVYYLRSRPAAEAIKTTISPTPTPACKQEPECVMCSA